MTPDRAVAHPVPPRSEISCNSPRPDAASGHSRLFLAVEFVLLFIGLPLALDFGLASGLPPLSILWVVAAWCLFTLVRDPTFDSRGLWNAAALRRQLPQMLALFAAAAALLALLVRLRAPHLFLALPRAQPVTWAGVMVLYPLLSVVPQSLVYRAFLFHRYRTLFASLSGLAAILLSASTFSLMHILFHNWLAVALTFPGGILFAIRYRSTRSLCASSLEHALYGCFLFTIGLGPFFGLRVS
jgi:uncharacterized protein